MGWVVAAYQMIESTVLLCFTRSFKAIGYQITGFSNRLCESLINDLSCRCDHSANNSVTLERHGSTSIPGYVGAPSQLAFPLVVSNDIAIAHFPPGVGVS